MTIIYQVTENGRTAHNLLLDQQVFTDAGFSAQTYHKYSAQIALNQIRQAREPLLSEADELVNIALDTGIDEQPFRQYRQQLRDITKAFQTMDDVVWPQKPSLSR